MKETVPLVPTTVDCSKSLKQQRKMAGKDVIPATELWSDMGDATI
jgi:hypothetical protein